MTQKKNPSSFLVQPWLIITVLCLVYCLAIVAKAGNPLVLVTIGSDFSPPDIDYAYSEEGYDAQFSYYIARDPNTAQNYIDEPAYRFQRILLPVLGMVLSFGQDMWIPWAFLLVNLIALAGGTYLLEVMLQEQRLSRWYAIGYGLTLGTFGATRLSTTEPLAYGLVLVGIFCIRKERWLWSAVMFALAGLAKETSLLFVGGYGLYWLWQRDFRKAFAFGIISLLPFVTWQGMLFNWFGEFGVSSGGAKATGFEMIPLMGFIRILTEGNLNAFVLFLLIIAPFTLVPTFWSLRQAWLDAQQKRWNIYTLLLFLNVFLMLFVPFSTYRELLGILRFIVGLQIAVILYASQNRNQRVLRLSTIWFVTILFIVLSDFGETS